MANHHTEPTDVDVLIEDLMSIWHRTGREVTYYKEGRGEIAYWPRRYLQSLQKAIDEGDPVGFVERLVTRDPTAGFGYLEAAQRPDLTVEYHVIDDSKPYHHLFSLEAIEASHAHLDHTEWKVPSKPKQASSAPASESAEPVEITVRVTSGGAVLYTEADGKVTTAATPFDALSVYPEVLSRALKAAKA